MDTYYIDDSAFLNAVDQLLAKAAADTVYTEHGKYFPTINEIPIKRVAYSGNRTIVWFTDDSKVIVRCSSHDKYDKQTAVAYALVKRLFGTVDSNTGLVDGAGIGRKLEDIAEKGFDQDTKDMTVAAKKAEAQAKHKAAQKKQQDAAFERRAQALAKQMRIQKRAEEILKEEASKPAKKKLLTEDLNTITAEEFFGIDASEKCNCGPKHKCNDTDEYVRPDKPFSQFTQEEKHAYWRYHNAMRRSRS